MEFHKYPLPLRNAITEIAAQFTSPITPSECAEHAADTDAIAAFWTLQRATGDATDHLCTIISDMDEAEQALLHSSLAADRPISQSALLERTVTHIAHWLAREADTYQADPANCRRRDPDDYGDWLHEQRKQARLDAMVSP